MSPSDVLQLRDTNNNAVLFYARGHYRKATLDGPLGYVIARVSFRSDGLANGFVASKWHDLDREHCHTEIEGPVDMVCAAIGLTWTLLAREIVNATR